MLENTLILGKCIQYYKGLIHITHTLWLGLIIIRGEYKKHRKEETTRHIKINWLTI